MNTRTWNLKLTATADHPETLLEGVSQDDAAKIVRGLMYGPGAVEYAHVQAAADGVSADRHEGALAA
jgi:glutamine synthetase type III